MEVFKVLLFSARMFAVFLSPFAVNFLDLIPLKGYRTYILAAATILFNLAGLILGKVDQSTAIEGITLGVGLLFAAQHGEVTK